MNKDKAYNILKITSEDNLESIKKKYRRLILQIHPDNNPSERDILGSEFTVQEINEAYHYLLKSEKEKIEHIQKSYEEEKKRWDAPENPYAFSERQIFHSVENLDGEVIGKISIARGKYLWTTQEEFSLFLLSIYDCSANILDNHNISEPAKKIYQPQLAYLITQQFIDGIISLRELVQETEDVFYIPSMLELTDTTVTLKAKQTLYPSRLANHRLYIKNDKNLELGYLSFTDDRLYYIVIPLFEQKLVQVKIKVKNTKSTSRKSKNFCNLDLWIRFRTDYQNTYPENINLQIENLLKKAQQKN